MMENMLKSQRAVRVGLQNEVSFESLRTAMLGDGHLSTITVTLFCVLCLCFV